MSRVMEIGSGEREDVNSGSSFFFPPRSSSSIVVFQAELTAFFFPPPSHARTNNEDVNLPPIPTARLVEEKRILRRSKNVFYREAGAYRGVRPRDHGTHRARCKSALTASRDRSTKNHPKSTSFSSAMDTRFFEKKKCERCARRTANLRWHHAAANRVSRLPLQHSRPPPLRALECLRPWLWKIASVLHVPL